MTNFARAVDGTVRLATEKRHVLPRAIGLAAGALAASQVLGPGLMPRKRADIAIGATGAFLIAGGAGWAAASGAQQLVRGVAGAGWVDARAARTGIKVGVAAALVGVGLIALRRWGTDATTTTTHDGALADGVDAARLDGAGKRFLNGVTKGLDQTPVRVFGGLKSGTDIQARAAAVLAQLDAAGGWEKDHIVVASPTGSGFVEPVLLEAVERITHGDVATVTMQSNNLPSALSVPKIPAARESHEALLEAIHAEKSRRFPHGGGPKVHVVGVSHGAWSSSDVFVGDPAGTMKRLGVEDGLFVGMPGLAKWDHVRGSGTVAGLTTYSNPNDPVNRFSLDLLWHRPRWLKGGAAARPAGVSKRERWTPVSTFMQTAVDLKNATAPARDAGRYVSSGHEYREIIPELVRTKLDLGRIGDEEFEGIRDAIHVSNRARATG